jgi:hypothetical protein
MLPVPQIPGGLAVSIVGIINGAINAIAPQVFALLHMLGLAPRLTRQFITQVNLKTPSPARLR